MSAVTPSKIFNSAVVAVNPSNLFNSSLSAVTPSKIFNSAAVDVTSVPANFKPFDPSCEATSKSYAPSETVRFPPTVNADNVPTEVICVCAASTLKVVPLFVKPVPAVIVADDENCVNDNAVVPTVIEPVVANTKPAFAFVVPSSTNVNAPDVTSVSSSKSVALVGAPLALTVYIPFSLPSAWVLIRILSPVANVIPSTVSPFANDEANVPAAVVATLTDSFVSNPEATESTYDFVAADVAAELVVIAGKVTTPVNVGLADGALAVNAMSKALPPLAADAVEALPVTSPVKSPVNTPAICPAPVIVGAVSVLFVNVCVSVN